MYKTDRRLHRLIVWCPPALSDQDDDQDDNEVTLYLKNNTIEIEFIASQAKRFIFVCRIEEVTDEMRKKSSYPVFFPHFSVNSSPNPWRPPRTPSLSRVYKIVWRRWSPGPIAPATEGRLWASTSRLFTPETFPCQYFDSGTPKLIVLHRLCNCECTKVHI